VKELSDLLGKNVKIVMRDADDVEGTLLSITNGGYFIKDSEGDYTFIPEANNVIFVYESKEE